MKVALVIFAAISTVCLGDLATSAPPVVAPGYTIELPRDGGSHPQFGTEWWYITGWLRDPSGTQRGFQLTFFRSRNAAADSNPSKFSPTQILFAHAALSDAGVGKLLRGERMARAGFGLAEAAAGSTSVLIDDWSLRTNGREFTAQVSAPEFSLSLTLASLEPILLQGDRGYSRKGPDAAAASYYYSLPQLQTHGSITIRGAKLAVTGQAWFDHEWSDSYLDAQSVGWDWIGINFANGHDALMAFRMRDTRGGQRWSAGTWRRNGREESFAPNQTEWTPLRHWRSPRTGVTYPVAWRIKIGNQEIVLRPLLDDQENDARGTVGILYWEGAVEALDDDGRLLGHGYLELTGYDVPVRL